ncbi:MAG: 5-formyltetrahydrofolate cyclo-ligase [Magnetospirillum sp.]|nr:5-formyltetrahydrofolate cyclo-ligase [Magnetospirillum sp.]
MTADDRLLPAAKARLRADMVDIRRRAFAEAGPAAAARLAAVAEALVRPGAVVAGYWPMGDEIDPRPLLTRLAALGMRLALPVVVARGQPLAFRAWRPDDVLEPGPHGTRHPAAAAPAVEPAVILLPLLAFDRRGFRLGYGGGYYDRTLDRLPPPPQVRPVGLAFAAQEVAAVPHDGHDRRLDAVVTEAGLLAMEWT